MKKWIKYIFILIIPYILLSLLYRRLFSYHKNIDIYDITINQLILYVYLCFIFFVLILFTIYRRYNKNSKNNVFSHWYLALSEQYYIALQTIETFIIEKILKKLKIDLSDYLANIVKYINYRKINLYIIYMFFIIPKIVVVIIFIIDIFIFNNLHYFYISLSFLLIPLIISYFLYAIKTQYKTGLTRIEKLVDVIDKNPNKGLTEIKEKVLVLQTYPLEHYINNKILSKDFDKLVIVLSLYTFESVKDAYKVNVKATLVKYLKYIDLLIDSKSIFYFVDQYRNQYDFYVNMFCYTTYFLGWTYIVLHNLY